MMFSEPRNRTQKEREREKINKRRGTRRVKRERDRKEMRSRHRGNIRGTGKRKEQDSQAKTKQTNFSYSILAVFLSPHTLRMISQRSCDVLGRYPLNCTASLRAELRGCKPPSPAMN